MSVDEALAAHREALMELPGVVGIAISLRDGERCINVLLADAAAGARVPQRLEGYRVVAEVTGVIRPH